MKLSVIASIRYPTEKAHGYQITRVCSELAAQGHDPVLFVPSRRNIITEEPFLYYGVDPVFPVHYVPVFDWLRFVAVLRGISFVLLTYFFLRTIIARSLISRHTVVYTRDALAVWYLRKRGFTVVYNAHRAPGKLERHLLTGTNGIVCNSTGTAEYMRMLSTAPVIVAENAADPNPYITGDKVGLRMELQLPATGPIIMYTGHLYGWKGAQTLVDAATYLPDVQIVLVGGTATEVQSMRRHAAAFQNVHILGHKPLRLVSKYLAAADILVLPNSARSEESVRYTSPLKLYDYMAAGSPIVASDLPAIRAILSERSGFFFKPDDPKSLAETVRAVIDRPAEARERAGNALVESKMRTWRHHAEVVASFLAAIQNAGVPPGELPK